MTVNGDSVEVELRVGMLDLALAKLMTEDHHTIEFPTILLPENVEAGSIVKLQCSRALDAEISDKEKFDSVQKEILETFATNLPQKPVLRARNVTQTSVVLEWDPIQVATSELHFLALYKGDQRLGLIPQPLKRTVTKVSNLEIDAPYDFHLVLSTSAGDFESNKLELKTHKMTDLTGVVVCLGSLVNSEVSEDEVRESLNRLGCKPPQESVKLDTTHFICTAETGPAYERAVELNIPIVVPQWLKACENERRLVSVRGFYLSANPSSYAHVTRSAEVPQPECTNDLQQPVNDSSNSNDESDILAKKNASPLVGSDENEQDPKHNQKHEQELKPVSGSEITGSDENQSEQLDDDLNGVAASREEVQAEGSQQNELGQIQEATSHYKEKQTQQSEPGQEPGVLHKTSEDNEPTVQQVEVKSLAHKKYEENRVSEPLETVPSETNDLASEPLNGDFDQKKDGASHEGLKLSNGDGEDEHNESNMRSSTVDNQDETEHDLQKELGKELEKELEKEPSASLKEGEEQRVTVEQAAPVESQSAETYTGLSDEGKQDTSSKAKKNNKKKQQKKAK